MSNKRRTRPVPPAYPMSETRGGRRPVAPPVSPSCPIYWQIQLLPSVTSISPSVSFSFFFLFSFCFFLFSFRFFLPSFPFLFISFFCILFSLFLFSSAFFSRPQLFFHWFSALILFCFDFFFFFSFLSSRRHFSPFQWAVIGAWFQSCR